MPSAQNVIGGRKAKANGQFFENLIKVLFQKCGYYIEKIPSGCIWIGKFARPTKTPFDYIAAKNKTVLIFDCKSVNSNSFSYSQIESHQLKSLASFQSCGINAGYIVWFRPENNIVFYSADILKNLRPRCSLKASDGIVLGSSEFLKLEGISNEKI